MLSSIRHFPLSISLPTFRVKSGLTEDYVRNKQDPNSRGRYHSLKHADKYTHRVYEGMGSCASERHFIQG